MLRPSKIEGIVVAMVSLVMDRAHGVPTLDGPEELYALLGEAATARLTCPRCPLPEAWLLHIDQLSVQEE